MSISRVDNLTGGKVTLLKTLGLNNGSGLGKHLRILKQTFKTSVLSNSNF